MDPILFIVIILVLFFFFGGFYVNPRHGPYVAWSPLVLCLIVVLLLWAFGVLDIHVSRH